ncbi:CHAT domain-containing protein [Nonomuraea endophytica]|uniref:Tetratricopeptide (TPR) repeat protein n=1 Tax=Nonomuraea endophytica TaxID=714136 RepID=A0A7W8EMW6_9ACTN|nr:CHAT domain-containing protein [Nonomuraea endophytica]MBB5084417.1 tetratricopeptide (TPR) repeat protein [Nonomuraea endophytica]
MSRSVVDPEQALAAGRLVLVAAEHTGAVEAAVVALRAMGLAARELGDLQAAERHLRKAIATPAAPPQRVAQARLSLVTVRTERGHPLQALRVAALAWAYLCPLDRAKLDTQRAVALAHLGRYQEAIAACDRSLETLATAPGTVDDRRFLAGGLLNRGLVRAYRGDWHRATQDITACLEISHAAGLAHLTRLAAANLPFLAVRRGDLAAAFAHYRAAEETLFGYPERLATMRADFAGALLAAHLPGEARALLSLAVPELEASGAHVALAEARLKLAQVELLTGDPRRAAEVAAQAAAELVAQDRESWLPLAREVELRSRLTLGPVTPALVRELTECADALEFGPACAVAAAALRLAAAEAALSIDDHPTASEQLGYLTAQCRRVRPAEGIPLASKAQAAHLAQPSPTPPLIRQHALALEAALQEDSAGAFRAVRDGLAEVGGQVESLDDPALRAHAARAGERLAAFGLTLAVRGGRAEEVFEWSEHWRAVTGQAPGGGRERGLPGVEAASSDRSDEGSEARTWMAGAERALGGVDEAAGWLRRVRENLGGAALVEYVVDQGALLAVVVTAEHVRMRRLAEVSSLGEAVVRLRYAMRRAALGDCPGAGGDAVSCGQEVDQMMFRPLAEWIGDRPLVVVPAGPLYTLPWSALPYLRGRPVTVAAAALSWLRARTAPRPARAAPVVAATAGPDLHEAPEEVRQVLTCHPGGHEIEARIAPVLRALAEVDVFHVAAHGVFQARSPLLSSITLADGPLMAYDLLGLDHPPRLVILSSCDAGMARAPCEGAPLGLAGTFLAQGTACVVAGMVPVRDEEALAVMTCFHELLAAGHSPSRALAEATAKTGVTAFACFGAGDRPLTT